MCQGNLDRIRQEDEKADGQIGRRNIVRERMNMISKG